jgi:CubicO group peptidase (beta-lactamase class C family)
VKPLTTGIIRLAIVSRSGGIAARHLFDDGGGTRQERRSMPKAVPYRLHQQREAFMRRRAILAASRSVAVASFLATAAAAGNPANADELPPPQVAGVPIPDGQIERAVGQLDTLAQAMLGKSGIPGLAVAVVRNGNTVYAKGFGLRKIGERQPVDADTVFQIASLSKSIGATVVAHQVGAGVVKWDTPLVTHLPWFELNDPWITGHVTIGDMFAHRSGLPDHAGDDLEDLGYDRRQILQRLRFAPLHSFRDDYAYTNFGLTAAAEAVAVASGKDWATLSDEVLYKPLGMTATSSRYADFAARDNRALLHVRTAGGFEPKYQRQPDAQSPAGGVSSNVRDLARWMAMVLDGGSYQGREIVAKDALLPAITPQIVSSRAYAADARAGFYGYGFGVSTQPSGRVVLSHSGAFSLGAGTNYVLIPSAHVGIVILTNGSPVGAAEALGMEFADLVQFGKVTRDWFAAYASLIAPMNAPFGTRVGKPPPADPAPALDLAVYAGTYANDYYGDAVIVRQPNGLTMKIGPAPTEFAFTHLDGNVFTFTPHSENASDGSISTATFATDVSGKVTQLKIELFDQTGIGMFKRSGLN